MNERRVKSLLDYWPIFAVIAGGITGYLQLKWTVQDMKSDLDGIETNIQVHRNTANEKEILEERRFTAIEKDLEWIKRRNRD